VLSQDLILPNIIADRAWEAPDRVFLRQIGDRDYTYAELDQLADKFAGGFARAGIGRDDRVLTMSPPRLEWLCAWLGLARLGAVDVAVNTGFRGKMLEYVLTRAEASALLISAEHVELLDPDLLLRAGIKLVVVIDAAEAPRLDGLTVVTTAEFLADPPPAPSLIRPNAWDTSCILLTSGTTGPSKLVQIPWGSMYSGGAWILPSDDMTPDDVWYQPLPTFHAAARFGIYLMALGGGRVAQRERFSLSSFWSDVREYGCTVTNMSPFAGMLAAQPERPDDADNPMRAAVINPAPAEPERFSRRFGLRLSASYGTSELGIPISAGWDVSVRGACGRPRPGWPGIQIKIVDEHDVEVLPGQVGELVVRSSEPWGLTSGYFRNPEATAAAWRNGWFHIGDAMRQDEEGNLYFHDRIKDAIRRRGENISSFEVEREVNAHPSVAESGAVAVSAALGEDDLKVFVVPIPGSELSPEQLWQFLTENVAKFMVPRYIELVTELPKTEASGRIKKSELRARGNNANTWDRERHAMATPADAGRSPRR
jgi:crotonobetaine/carnitine-CoA ligase